MIPKTTINQVELWQQCYTMALSKQDWSTGSKYCAFDNKDVPTYTEDEIFPVVLEFKDGRKIRRVSTKIEDTRAEAQYELIKEGQEAPRPKKKRATKKKVVKEED